MRGLDIKQLQDFLDNDHTITYSHLRTVKGSILHLVSELGELITALKNKGLFTEDDITADGNISDEIADIVILACIMANRVHTPIDLDIQHKLVKNYQQGKIGLDPREYGLGSE